MSERNGRPKLRLIASGGEEIVGPRSADVARAPAPASSQTSDEPLMHELSGRRDRKASPKPASMRANRPPRMDKTASQTTLRLLDTDGIQPAQTPPDDPCDEAYYEHEHDLRRIAADLNRLRFAIVDLAAIELPPERLLQELSPGLDRPVIAERLEQAMAWLERFYAEWEREGTGSLPR